MICSLVRPFIVSTTHPELIQVIGISVRDFNYYPHFQDERVRERVCETIRSFWEDEIRGDYDGGPDCELGDSDVSP